MPEQKQTEQININLLSKDDEEQKYLLHVEEKFVEDIAKKVLTAKSKIENEQAGDEAKAVKEINNTLKSIIRTLFTFFVAICFFMLVFLFTFVQIILNYDKNFLLKIIISCLTCLALSIICIFCAFICIKLNKVIKTITSNNYIISLFSAIIAVSSFLVSCINFISI